MRSDAWAPKGGPHGRPRCRASRAAVRAALWRPSGVPGRSGKVPPFSSHTQEETLPMYITTNSKSQDVVSTSNINNHNQATLNSVVFLISWQQLQNTEYPVLGDRATMLSTPLSDPIFTELLQFWTKFSTTLSSS